MSVSDHDIKQVEDESRRLARKKAIERLAEELQTPDQLQRVHIPLTIPLTTIYRYTRFGLNTTTRKYRWKPNSRIWLVVN